MRNVVTMIRTDHRPTTPMRIERTTIADKIPATLGIQTEHWHETARNKHLMMLKPDLPRYQTLEAHGALLSLVAYDDSGEVIGYSVNIMANHLHYADLRVCHNDVLFVRESHRNSPLGLKLIKETERLAKEAGCQLMLWHAKENTALAKILPRTGCKVQEIMFSKEL